MRILIAAYWSLPTVSGLWSYIRQLKSGLENAGHEVCIFAHHPDYIKYYTLDHSVELERHKIKNLVGAKLQTLYVDKYPNTDPWIRELEIERYSYELAVSYLGLDQFQMIHAQDVLAIRALQRAKPAHVPLVSTIHGSMVTDHILSGNISPTTQPWHYCMKMDYHCVADSNAVIVPSEWMKKVIVDYTGAPSNLMKVVPNGMDVDGFVARMGENPTVLAPPDKTVIICTARLIRAKGHSLLLEALSKLKTVRSDWVCWLVGEGPMQGELESLSAQLGIQEHVRFLGNRQDIPALLQQAHISVLPSQQENLPFAIMEAQIAGKPVLATDSGGVPEMINHGYSGLISAKGQSEPLFRNLLHLMENRSAYDYLSERSKQSGRQRWALDNMVNRTIDIYHSLLS